MRWFVCEAHRVLFTALLIAKVASFTIPSLPSFKRDVPLLRLSKCQTRVPDLDLKNQVYCNVELNEAYIEAVGFDMDFTLAQYNPEYGKLMFEHAKEKLVKAGYPKDVLAFESRPNDFLRGLVIDKERGNILKIDRHKYVRSAMHGSAIIPTATRKSLYNKEVVSFSEDNFVNIDSMYLLVDAQLFSHLVDLRDRTPAMHKYTYEQIYSDVRHAVEDCLREGTVGQVVMHNPGKYITYDEGVVHTLTQLRDANKRTFLLTNSFWNYTNAIMDYVVHGGDNKHKDIDWKDLINIIIVGANKPAFLTNDALSLFKVDTYNGVLHNLDDRDSLQSVVQPEYRRPRPELGGSSPARAPSPSSHASSETSDGDTNIGTEQKDSTCATSSQASSAATTKAAATMRNHKVFQGGYWQDLHRLLGVSYGDKILYVGDQMFSDILRSKRSLGWRTCLIVPELEHETSVANRERALHSEVLRLKQEQHDLDEYADQLSSSLEGGDASVTAQLTCTHTQAETMKKDLRSALARYDAKFNVLWGQLFKAGLHDSRFAKQVRNYACLYTSKVSNLRYVSPWRCFRPVNDFMSHDQILGGDSLTQGYPVSDAASD